jgi:hypothetical protein
MNKTDNQEYRKANYLDFLLEMPSRDMKKKFEEMELMIIPSMYGFFKRKEDYK